MPMTHGFSDAENKLTGRPDPLHAAFLSRFAAYRQLLRRSRAIRVYRRDACEGKPVVLSACCNRDMRGLSMGRVHFSPKAFAGFVVFLVAFGLLVSMDQGSGPISRAWPILMSVFLLGGTFAIYRQMWRARNSSDDIRRAEAQGLYGVLPKKLRIWLFP